MGRICLFLRVSTIGQQLESQEDSLRRAALADGYKEDDIIVIGKKESAIKLSEEEREGLNELKVLIDKEDIDCIYIAELSRLSRRPHILYSIRELLLQKKIQLKCLNPQFTLLNDDRTKYDSSANLIFSLFGALAEQEMLEKKERFARGKKRKADENKYSGGRVPYGYRVDEEQDNLIVVDEHEGEIVKLIYDLYENGMSQPKIAKELNTSGKANIKISLINNILTNESYTGKKIKQKNASYERAYHPIITQEQFDKCRTIAKQNNTNLSKAKNIYFADHLVRCSSCGAFWSATGSKASYHCAAAYKSPSLWNYEYHRKERCTNKSSISINVLDSVLWFVAIEKEAQYMEQATEDTINEYNRQIDKIKDKLHFIEPRLKELEAKKGRLHEVYIDGGISKDNYHRKLNELQISNNEIKSEEIGYRDELKRIGKMINQLKELEQSRPFSMSDLTNFFDGKVDKLQTSYPFIHSKNKLSIAQIKDDKVRYEIIHRQIKSIDIVPTKIRYPFRSGEKDVMCKKIIVHTFLPTHYGKEIGHTEGKYVFYSIPSGGYGPLIIDTTPEMIDEDTLRFYKYDEGEYDCGDEISDKIYLDRYRDNPKYKRRSAKSKQIIQDIGDKLSIRELMKKYHLSYGKIYDWIHKGKIHGEMINGVYYVSPIEAEEKFGKTIVATPTILDD